MLGLLLGLLSLRRALLVGLREGARLEPCELATVTEVVSSRVGLQPAHQRVCLFQPALVGGDVRGMRRPELVRLLLVVHASDFDWITRVDVIDVLHALHHPALVDVEARNDPLQQHATRSRAEPSSPAPV